MVEIGNDTECGVTGGLIVGCLHRFRRFQARPLTTAVVREIREEYATLHGQEIAAILAAQEGLTRIR